LKIKERLQQKGMTATAVIPKFRDLHFTIRKVFRLCVHLIREGELYCSEGIERYTKFKPWTLCL